MAVIMLEDPHGSVEVVIFPEAFGKCASVLEAGAMVVVKGKVELDEEVIRLMANEVRPIEAMRQKMSRELSIKLTSPPQRQTFEALADCSHATAATGGWCSSSSCAINSRPCGYAHRSPRPCAYGHPSSWRQR